jgi:hypothetical protein
MSKQTGKPDNNDNYFNKYNYYNIDKNDNTKS